MWPRKSHRLYNFPLSNEKLTLKKYFCCNLGAVIVDYYENVGLFIERE